MSGVRSPLVLLAGLCHHGVMAAAQPLDTELAAAETQRAKALARYDEASERYQSANLELGMAKADLDAAEARLASLLDLSRSLSEASVAATDQPTLPLSALSRTDAIVEILKAHDTHLGISDVVRELEPHDPDAKYQVVASTLNYLVREGRVTRPTRGRYAVVR